MSDKAFFTKAFENLPPEELEEFYRTVFMHMDSVDAMRLRLEYYRPRLRHLGKNVRLGSGVRIINPQWISIGDEVKIGDECVLIATSEKGITLEDGVNLKHGVYLDGENPESGYIHIGKRAYIGTRCCLHGHKGLEIGEDTLLAQNITITPYSHIFEDPDRPIISQDGHSRKITIGRDCYLGMHVCVLCFADIGDGAVIGSGSVVTRTIPPFSVAVGVPARVIRKREKPKEPRAEN